MQKRKYKTVAVRQRHRACEVQLLPGLAAVPPASSSSFGKAFKDLTDLCLSIEVVFSYTGFVTHNYLRSFREL